MLNEMPWLRGRMVEEPVGAGGMARTAADVEPFVNYVARVSAEHGVANEPVGIAGTTSGLLLGEAFKAKGINVVDGRATMTEARKIKNQDEVECVRMACSNAEAAFADIVDAIRPGVTECELVGVGMKTLYRLGADEAQEFVCSSGPRTNPLYIDYTDRQIRPGDLVIIDINANSWQGYKSCYYRTFCCGRATQEQKEIYEECRSIMYDAMGAVKAGNTTADVGSKLARQTWGSALGHGIGLSLHEMPMIGVMSMEHPVELELGMVLAIETWAGRKGGRDGVRLEENLAVTEDGYDLLSRFPVAEVTECWI
jgi:Xaa-Pro dipeptidase